MLTEEQMRIGRRNFLRAIAALPALGAFAWSASRSERPLAVAVIGAGVQGRRLMERSPTALLRYVAVADILPANRERALATARRIHDIQPDAYESYEDVLRRDDIQAVVVATPLRMHAPIALDALRAGKHVYCEAMMAYSGQQCDALAEALAASGCVLQIGHQRRCNEIYRHAIEIVRSGMLGDILHIRAQWHRNDDWRRAASDDGFDPSSWGYETREHLNNWRLIAKHSQGLMAEFGSHQIDVVNWITRSAPTAAVGSGGTYRYRDEREVEDHVFAVLEYPTNVTLTYSAILSNAFEGRYEQIMGTRGTLILRNESDAFLFTEDPSHSRAPDGAGEWELESPTLDEAAAPASAESIADARPRSYRDSLRAFVHAIRTGEPPPCGVGDGRAATIAALTANEAIRTKRRVELPGANVA